MLEIKNVHKTFNPGTINEKKALNGIDLTLNEGDFVTIIGGNGAGKSTMLNMIAGVYPVDCGSIVIDGVDVTKLPEHKRAKYIGRVFQDPMTGTAANMQIIENLALASRRGSRRGLGAGVKRKDKEHKRTGREKDSGDRAALPERACCGAVADCGFGSGVDAAVQVFRRCGVYSKGRRGLRYILQRECAEGGGMVRAQPCGQRAVS